MPLHPMEFGVSSMTSPLRTVLVQAPADAFARRYASAGDEAFRTAARSQHAGLVRCLEGLGVAVLQLDDDGGRYDSVYTYDPALVTRRGAVLLRAGKPDRRGEEDVMARWFEAQGVPIVGRIDDPGTVDGGDVFWLDADTVCIGRSLRTNDEGIRQLSALLDEDVAAFDLPYDAGPAHCLHLLSVISPIADDLAVIEAARLPAGLWQLLASRDIRTVPVAPAEIDALACNVLTVRPGVVVMLDGAPRTQEALEAAGVEIHTFEGSVIGVAGGGGPTCLTRPVLRR
jgi:N-dimethylarginine dimethylaminohydrolase